MNEPSEQGYAQKTFTLISTVRIYKHVAAATDTYFSSSIHFHFVRLSIKRSEKLKYALHKSPQ